MSKIMNARNLFETGAVKGVDSAFEQTNNTNMLGAVCWWTVYGANVHYEEYTRLMVEAGVPEGWLLPKHTNKAAYMAMVNQINAEKTIPATLKKITLGTANGREPAVHAIVTEVVDRASERYIAKQVGKVIYNHKFDALEFEWDANINHPGLEPSMLETEVRDRLYHQMTHFTSTDIRANILDIVLNKLRGFRVRPSGGIYFVSREYVKHLEAIDTVVKAVSDDILVDAEEVAGVSTLSIVDGARERAGLMVHYAQYLKTELAKLTAGLDEAKKDGRNMRESSVIERIQQLKAVREKAEHYEALFNATMHDVSKSIADAQAKLSEHIVVK